MTDPVLMRVKAALIDLAGGMNAPDTRVLVQRMAELDDLLEQEGGSLEARLRHFLQQRSYAKALAMLARSDEAATARE